MGHLPVIHPGEIFEYMSGCEIGTKTGLLSGLFYMAQVHEETPSAMVGDAVEALKNDRRHRNNSFSNKREKEEEEGKEETIKFEMPIGPFCLVSEGMDNYDANK